MPNKHESTAIIVLGMHRSGTSALSGCLHHLGVDFGDSLINADSNNPSGYWEDSTAVNINDQLLQRLHRSWQNELPMPSERVEQDDIKQDIIRLIEKKINSPLWGLKDPRLSCTLPIWVEQLHNLITNVIYILVIRNPASVANSLKKRDRISPKRGYLIWLRYLLDAEYNTRGKARFIVDYDQLMNNWEACFEKIECIDLKIKMTPEIKETISTFLSPHLHHHRNRSMFNESDDWLTIANRAYNAVNWVHQSISTDTLDEIRKQLDNSLNGLEPWITQIQEDNLYFDNKIKIDNLQFQETIITLHNQTLACINSFESEIRRIKSTLSWRATKPFRAIWNALKKIIRINRARSESVELEKDQ